MSLYFSPDAIVAVPSASTETGAGGVNSAAGVAGGVAGAGEVVTVFCDIKYAMPAITSAPIIRAIITGAPMPDFLGDCDRFDLFLFFCLPFLCGNAQLLFCKDYRKCGVISNFFQRFKRASSATLCLCATYTSLRDTMINETGH